MFFRRRSLRAAHANIGAARAAFFPRIALSVRHRHGERPLYGLFQAGRDAWNYSSQIVMPTRRPAWGALKATKVAREIG